MSVDACSLSGMDSSSYGTLSVGEVVIENGRIDEKVVTC